MHQIGFFTRRGFWLALFLVLLSAALYLPWRDNPLVFDDPNILRSTALFDYAQLPFSLSPRQFPYFTLGFEHVISGGDFRLSRYVNLLLHALNGFVLFLLVQQLLQRMVSSRRALAVALGIAMVFIVHPVAVYAVGYLVQRTVLFATLFLMLSAWQFDRALSEHSWLRAAAAGLCFGLSVMCKEHALTGLVGVLGVLLVNQPATGPRRTAVVLAFLATAMPFALWIASLKLGFVASAYEPDAHELISALDFPDQGSRLGNWMLSAALQCLFFFRYLGVWCWPDPSGLSIDIRPDFSLLAHMPWLLTGPLALVALAAGLAFAFASHKVRPELKLAAYGLLWALGLFLVELSTVRFQEAIVLYRSYLWAPGFLLAIAGLASMVPVRPALALTTAAVLALVPLSWERLHLFSDELMLWQEAAAKLPRATSPGAIRIHYNLGVFHAKAGQMDAALEDFGWVIRQDPEAFHGYWGRSTVYLSRNALPQAAGDLNTVIRLNPGFGMAYFQLGMVLRKLGQLPESESAFSKAEKLGIFRMDFK